MKIQPDNHSCGVYVVLNALKAMGVRGNVKKILQFSKTTEDGTREHGIMAALTAYGFTPEKFVVHDKNSLYCELMGESPHKNLETEDSFYFSFPIIACVDKFNHWILILGVIGDKFIIVDSDNSQKNKKENGIYVLTFPQLAKRWRGPNGGYFGIICNLEAE